MQGSKEDFIFYQNQEEPVELPEIKVELGLPLKEGEKPLKDIIMVENAMKTVEDPDVKIDVVNLGLIYKKKLDSKGNVTIDMTLTSPTCPYANDMVMWVAEAIQGLEGIGIVKVSVVWEPKWSIDMLSEEAKFDLDMI